MKINTKVILGLIVGMIIAAGCAHKAQHHKAGHKGHHHGMFQSVPKTDAVLLQSGDQKQYCPVCGMNLPMFYKTNHSAITKDGEVRQYCSMHCVVDDNEHNHQNLKDFKVIAANSLKFIDAKSATYVVGSEKKGTMSMISKYAFSTKNDAKAFQTDNGGTIMNFDEAYAVAKGDFDKDNKMISHKRSKVKLMGKMLYMSKCDKIDEKFADNKIAKAYINKHKSCGNIDEKKLHAISIYLGSKDK